MSQEDRDRQGDAASGIETGTEKRGGRLGADTTTRGIRIQVTSRYLPDRSSPKEGTYLFTYHVRISNVGEETAQLVSREWIITNADGEVERVKGPGVVGEQPVLDPGDTHRYTSGAVITTPVGTMEGTYEMHDGEGGMFRADIPRFSLRMPGVVQ